MGHEPLLHKVLNTLHCALRRVAHQHGLHLGHDLREPRLVYLAMEAAETLAYGLGYLGGVVGAELAVSFCDLHLHISLIIGAARRGSAPRGSRFGK